MKKISFKIFPMLVASLLVLSSCLKDSDYENGAIQSTHGSTNQNLVEIHLTTGDNSNVVSRSYDNMERDTTISLIPINLTSGPASSEVTVTLDLLDTITSPTMKSYVLDDGFVIPNPTKYVVLNAGNKVVIPAGSSTGYLKVKFKPSDFLGDTYIFGVKIKSISDSKYVISNLSEGYVKFGIKNMYDGEYEVSGTMADATNPALVGAYPMNVYLITQSGVSNAMFDLTYNNYYHLIKNGASFSVYGSFAPVFKFDANNNVVEVTNLYGQPASNGRSAQLDPSGINKYDPATKTIKVKYWLNQPGSSHRTSFNETFTYVGPR